MARLGRRRRRQPSQQVPRRAERLVHPREPRRPRREVPRLERAGYVDCLGFAWGNDVISVRLTEEGRDAAETVIGEELESPAISDETRSSIKGALISQGIGIAANLLLKLISIG